MELTNQEYSISKTRLWIGRVTSAIAVLFMIFDGIIHILKPPQVAEAFNKLGYPLETSITLGIIEILCLIIYLIPQSSFLGAVLLTGYLGGATASQLRIGEPLFSNMLFPVYVGILLWGGLYLRDRYLSSIFPIRKK